MEHQTSLSLVFILIFLRLHFFLVFNKYKFKYFSDVTFQKQGCKTVPVLKAKATVGLITYTQAKTAWIQ